MVEKAEWKETRVGHGEVDHMAGWLRRGWRRGSDDRAGRESMMEATKAAKARVVASGREIPPAEAGRRIWKAVRLGLAVRRTQGLRRRMAAMARTAALLAAAARGSTAGLSGGVGL